MRSNEVPGGDFKRRNGLASARWRDPVSYTHLYDYRYTDIHKKRRCIYAKSLTELRKKEEELWRDLADGIDYAAGEMTVADPVSYTHLDVYKRQALTG